MESHGSHQPDSDILDESQLKIEELEDKLKTTKYETNFIKYEMNCLVLNNRGIGRLKNKSKKVSSQPELSQEFQMQSRLKIQVMDNGFDPEFFEPILSDKDETLYISGRTLYNEKSGEEQNLKTITHESLHENPSLETSDDSSSINSHGDSKCSDQKPSMD